MNYTQSDLERLDRAIASSQLTVQYGERRVTFRSMDELLRARQHVESQLKASSGRSVYRFTFATGRGH